ncbi:MAG: exopolysaccharide biosynthesis polyprenyl glycosylphosphotransferase [Fusobacteriaceae bacterium]
MEYRKDSNLKIVYMLLTGGVYIATNSLLPIGKDMNVISAILFFLINLCLYITGCIQFHIPKYKKGEIFMSTIINITFFFLWFIYSWDFWLLPFLVIYLMAQIIIRGIMLKATFKTGYVTVLGNGKTKTNIEEGLTILEGYKYIPYPYEIDENLSVFTKENKISLVVLGKPKFTKEETKHLFNVRISGVEVKNYYDFLQEIEGKIDVDTIDEKWILNAYGFRLLYSNFEKQVKRAFDLILALIIGLITCPIMAIATIIVRAESPGPIIYSQARVGENNIEFNVYKFRSMRNDAEKDGAKWATLNDPRVTKFGNFMRKTRIDELPQLWNVIKGDMSFIGPRPERMVFIKELEKIIPYYNLRHLVKPGLTGWAQVMYPYGASIDDAKHKLEYDLYYVKNQNIHLDMVIMFRTLKTVLFGKGR